MDLAELASVRQAAAELLASTPKIDALICSAAIAQVATQEITADGFESQLGVNHFAHFLLCGLLLERIEASKGRVVVVRSNGYKMGHKTIQFDDLNYDQKSPFVQSAEKGSWPEVMCATADGLTPETYYGPTRAEMVGAIDACKLEDFVLDQETATKLWAISEEKTSLSWSP